MKIRRVTVEDAVVAAKIHVDAWRSAYRGLVPDAFLQNMSYARREEAFRNSIAAKQGDMYLVEYQNTPVGLLTIGPCRDADLDIQTTGEIYGIYLIPETWRQGIGTWLAAEAERMLQARGYQQIMLWVFEGNSNARRFYEAVGYRVDGASKTIDLGKPLEVIRYRKAVDSGRSVETEA